MNVNLDGYTKCQTTFSALVTLCVTDLARHFIIEIRRDRASRGKRYLLRRAESTYVWVDGTNNATVAIRANVEREANGKFWVSIDFEFGPGLPCKFLVSYDVDELNSLILDETYHKGTMPENPIIQGIYGRLVENTEELDYKDLDYV